MSYKKDLEMDFFYKEGWWAAGKRVQKTDW